MDTRKSIKYISTRERRNSLVEITDHETGEISKFKPEKELGSGTYGMVRLFKFNDQKIAVKSPHTKETKELNRRDVKEKHVDTDHEFELMREAYPEEFPFYLTHFEGKANIKEYFHDYRMVIPFFTGTKLANFIETIEHTLDFAKLLLLVAAELLRLHSIGIIHGDVSENNIIVHIDNDEIKIYFIDFGLAYRITEPANLNVVEYNYLAPERLQKDLLQAHPSQDVYSLASLAKRLLSKMGDEWRDYFLGKYSVVDNLIKSSLTKDPNNREHLNYFVANLFSEITETSLSPNQKLLVACILSRDSENLIAQINDMRQKKLHIEIIDTYLLLFQYKFYKELLYVLKIDSNTLNHTSEINRYFLKSLLLANSQNKVFITDFLKTMKANTLQRYLFNQEPNGSILLRSIALQKNRFLITELINMKLVILPEELQTDLLTYIPNCSDDQLLQIVDILIVINDMLPKESSKDKHRHFSPSKNPRSNAPLTCAHELLATVIYPKTVSPADEQQQEMIQPHPSLSELTINARHIESTEATTDAIELFRPLCNLV